MGNVGRDDDCSERVRAEREPELRGCERWLRRGRHVSHRQGALRDPERLVHGWLSVWNRSVKSTWSVL